MAVIILEDLNFYWKEKDIEKVLKAWEDNMPVPLIAREVRRNIDETFLLLMHLTREGKLKKRAGYFWGGNEKLRLSVK